MYYSQENIGSSKTQKVFLLRYQDPRNHAITNEGPFKDEHEACDKLSSFLKKGICSWLVTYYD